MSTEVALGFKAHSGWAALVALARSGGDFAVADRRRVELAEEEWARQPYHAAEELKPEAARDLVRRGVAAARRLALAQMRAAVEREKERGHAVGACAVLMGTAMPAWSVDEILAVHFRMHKAEGVLFRDALAQAATECGLRLVAIPEKELARHAEAALGPRALQARKSVAAWGKAVGPPWGRDQKDAALAALVALHQRAPARRKGADDR